ITDFKFLISIVFWHNILFQVNVVSKALQTQSVDIATATTLMRSCLDFVVTYKDNGFEHAITAAREMAKNLGVEPIFKETHIHWKKRQFGYKGRDEVTGSLKEKFKREVFLLTQTKVWTNEAPRKDLEFFCMTF
ncbi:hypothetical protein KIL84_016350, partial [Mauremys mutica]